jgi:hypothetical protein
MTFEMSIENDIKMSQIIDACSSRYEHMSLADKACMLAIKGKLPESNNKKIFDSSEAYVAFWNTFELIVSNDIIKLNKLLNSLFEQLDPISERSKKRRL